MSTNWRGSPIKFIAKWTGLLAKALANSFNRLVHNLKSKKHEKTEVESHWQA